MLRKSYYSVQDTTETGCRRKKKRKSPFLFIPANSVTVEKITLRGIAQGDQNIMQKLEHAKCFVSRRHISDTSGDREEALSALCALMIFFTSVFTEQLFLSLRGQFVR